MRPGWLLALCYIGALTHPLLDLQTTYSVQLFSPLSGRWFHSDSLFIIDVWLWSLLGVTIAWSRMREKQRRPHWQRPVQRALAIAFAYICLNIGLSERAIAEVRARHPEGRRSSPRPRRSNSWQRREMSWRNDDQIHRAPAHRSAALGPTARPVRRPTWTTRIVPPRIRARSVGFANSSIGRSCRSPGDPRASVAYRRRPIRPASAAPGSTAKPGPARDLAPATPALARGPDGALGDRDIHDPSGPESAPGREPIGQIWPCRRPFTGFGSACQAAWGRGLNRSWPAAGTTFFAPTGASPPAAASSAGSPRPLAAGSSRRFDRRLELGGIDATLPGGKVGAGSVSAPRVRGRPSPRLLSALIRLALSGSVGWYKAWEMAEWSSPDPVKVFETLRRQRHHLGQGRPRQGPVPARQRHRSPAARQRPAQRPPQHRRALRPRQ